jgi:hypothetical protein
MATRLIVVTHAHQATNTKAEKKKIYLYIIFKRIQGISVGCFTLYAYERHENSDAIFL